jgi:hypothetical protein
MSSPRQLAPATQAFYQNALRDLSAAGIPFLVGGAYALEHYTGIVRDTKDLDVFVRQRDLEPALERLAGTGCRTEITFPHWLGKAHCGDDYVDVIFSSGNGVAGVDDDWFRFAAQGTVLGVPVQICPAEETMWSKAFLMERERFDGADVMHLLLARAEKLSWPRLVSRFGVHWRVLLAHLVLFGFVYPRERARIPAEVLDDLLERMERETHEQPPDTPVCQGTLLSREQYLIDVQERGLGDARLGPGVNMTGEDVERWTRAITEDAHA